LTIAAILAALAIAIVALPLARYPVSSGTGGSDSIQYVSAVATTTDLSAPAVATLTWSAKRVVSFTGLSGSIITEVFARPGAALACGATVFEVDNGPIVAFCGHRPLWRTVTGGMTGYDVNEVVAYLRSGGWLRNPHPSPTSFTIAIEAWQRANGMGVTGLFDATQIVWIGQPLIPAVVDVYVGEVVEQEMQVLTGAARILSAYVSPIPTGYSVVWLFNVAGLPMTTVVDRTGAIANLLRLSQMVSESQPPDGTPPLTVQGQIRLKVPLAVVAIPASAVISGDSATCVAVLFRRQVRVITVDVVDSQVGSVFVAGKIHGGDEVVANPSEQHC